MRKYLNGEFYEKFSEGDRSRIIPVINKNSDNQWYGTEGGVDTQDNIFLLSLEEVCKYFGDSLSKLQNPGKNQRYWFERKDENNSKRIARLEGKEGAWWWWLRSPGRVKVKAVYIFGTDGIQKVEEKVSRWIDSTNFEFDQDRSVMFNMPYLYEDGRDLANYDIEKGLGYKQMQRYFPIKLKRNA